MSVAKTTGIVGEATITDDDHISLPAEALRVLGWQRGDRMVVQVLGQDFLVLMRRPESWTEFFAGKMGDVFGTHEEILRYLEEERRSWEEEE